MKQSDFQNPPIAQKIPHTFTEFDKARTDDYFWLKDKNSPKVIEYLKAENAYTENVMASTTEMQEILYKEILGRIKEDDESFPIFKNGYYYYSRTEKGKQYAIYFRKKNLEDAGEVLLDLNEMASGKDAFVFAGYAVSPDNQKIAYIYNETGSYAEFTLKVKNLETKNLYSFMRDGVTSVAWANDSETIFFTVIDSTTLRPYKVCYSHIDFLDETVIYEENDAKFIVDIAETKLRNFIFISSESSTTSEISFICTNDPKKEVKVFLPRKKDIRYTVISDKFGFFIMYKDNDCLNGKVYFSSFEDYKDKAKWVEVKAHDEKVRIESVHVIKDYLFLELRKNGLVELEALKLHLGKVSSSKKISFPEVVYFAELVGNPEYEVSTIRYVYSSLNRPLTLYEYNVETLESKQLKVREIPSGFNPDNYNVERLWAPTIDGVKVPIAILYKKGLKRDGSNPTLLYSYGSYGISCDMHFNSSVFSLVDRGFIYAVAQIRGGSDLGEIWYEDGKLLKKKNTFTDFIACAEHLINEKYTSSEKLVIQGGSAGGLLMGAVTNLRPELFKTVIAMVPFVDVVTTMLDESLPLTVGEYEEWGNPNEKDYYDYMLSYSPYDNIIAQKYPNILVTGGLNDSQVLFHEPAKYTAKLRALKTDNNILLLHMDMSSGHGGATGRYGSIKDTAFIFAFILKTLEM